MLGPNIADPYICGKDCTVLLESSGQRMVPGDLLEFSTLRTHVMEMGSCNNQTKGMSKHIRL